MTNKILEKSLIELTRELEGIEKEISKGSSLEAAVKAQSKKKIVVSESSVSLKELGAKIAKIDEQLQKVVACDARVPTLLKAKRTCQTVFERVFEKYCKKLSKSSAEHADKAKKRIATFGGRLAEAAMEKALGQITAEEGGKTALADFTPRLQDLVPYAESPSTLRTFFLVCDEISNIPAHQRDQTSTLNKIAYAFMQLPFSLRRELMQAFSLEASALAPPKKKGDKLSRSEKIAANLSLLSIKERAFLYARLKNSSNPKHQRLARFIKEFEKHEQMLALAVAAKGTELLKKGIEGIAKKTVETSGFSEWGRFFQATKVVADSRAEQMVLGELYKLSLGDRGTIFSRLYGEIASIFDRNLPERVKKAAVLSILQKLPQPLQNDIYEKVDELLNPDQQSKAERGERHVLDHWGILLKAIGAFCPVSEEHPLEDLQKEIQTILYDHRLKDQYRAQRAVKAVLEQFKTTVSPSAWDEFKEQFFHRFPGQEKWQWGFGGEERELHKYPYHVLLTLHAMRLPFSRALEPNVDQAPQEASLLEGIRQGESAGSAVFARFYRELTAIIHLSIPRAQKEGAIRGLIQKIPSSMQGELYGKIYELNPARQPRLGWGERHALDNLGILLSAAFAFCPSSNNHPLQLLFTEIQKVIHDPKTRKLQEKQMAVRSLLEKHRAKVPPAIWNQFKEQFFHHFPGSEKWQWGFGGEEREAHKYPDHVLLTLYAMIVPSSTPNYWDEMRVYVRGLNRQEAAEKIKVMQKLRVAARMPGAGQPISGEQLWQSYNAIEGAQRTRVFGKLQKSPFFDKMWRMSPLCSALYHGQVQAVDPTTLREIEGRLALLENLENAKEAVKGQYPLDPTVWNALIYRIILQEEPLNEEEIAGIRVIFDALGDLAADKTYNPEAAKEILEMLINMSSGRYAAGAIDHALTFKEVRRIALRTALRAKPLDHEGPTGYKPLTFFKDRQGTILAKLKPLDPAMGNSHTFQVEQFFREIASSQMDDTLGFKITVPTAPLRLTLGEGILMLAELYTSDPAAADKEFALVHPFLQEAIKKHLPSWEHAQPAQKKAVLEEFYNNTGATDLLHLMEEKLLEGVSIKKISPLFRWLPANIRNSVYGVIFQIASRPKKAPFNYGELAFHDIQFSTSPGQKIEAITRIKAYKEATGLQHTYLEEGFGTVQPWAQGLRPVIIVLSKDIDGAKQLIGVPKERTDLYSLFHILKSEGDSYPGNTLISQDKHFIDCDEEHALQDEDHIDKMVMWELGLPQAKTPIKPLLLRIMRHPYFQRTLQRMPRILLTTKSRLDRDAPLQQRIRKSFTVPLENLQRRAQKIQEMTAPSQDKAKGVSVRDLFFNLYGGEKEYRQCLSSDAMKGKTATIFEMHIGKKAIHGAPYCASRWQKSTYVENIRQLSA